MGRTPEWATACLGCRIVFILPVELWMIGGMASNGVQAKGYKKLEFRQPDQFCKNAAAPGFAARPAAIK
jgi:hypothetical protein